MTLKDELGFYVTVPETLVERASEIGSDALTLFIYLRYRTNRKRGEAWPGYRRMATDLRWGNDRISEAIQTLESEGWLERRRRFGETTVYTLKHVVPPDVAGTDASPPALGGLETDTTSPPALGAQSSRPRSTVLLPQERIQDLRNPTLTLTETEQPRAADSPARRSKAERLAGGHQVLKIMAELGISDGQAQKLSLHFTPSEAQALADLARKQEPDDLGAYASQLFRDYSVQEVSA